MGLLREDGGDIVFQGKRLTKISAKEAGCRRRQMHMLFQNPASSLNPRMKIRESMEEPAKIHGMDISRGQEIRDMMKRLQLREELLHRYPHQLSGGELQRVCLGRLLLLKPGLLILDEPTSMLDVSVQAQIIGILKEVQEEKIFPIFSFPTTLTCFAPAATGSEYSTEGNWWKWRKRRRSSAGLRIRIRRI